VHSRLTFHNPPPARIRGMAGLHFSAYDPECWILVALWCLRMRMRYLYSRGRWQHGRVASWVIYAAMLLTVIVWGFRKQN
jgi:hypothetical protein